TGRSAPRMYHRRRESTSGRRGGPGRRGWRCASLRTCAVRLPSRRAPLPASSALVAGAEYDNVWVLRHSKQRGGDVDRGGRVLLPGLHCVSTPGGAQGRERGGASAVHAAHGVVDHLFHGLRVEDETVVAL